MTMTMQAIRIHQIHQIHHRNQENHRCNQFIQMNHRTRTAKQHQPHDEQGPQLTNVIISVLIMTFL